MKVAIIFTLFLASVGTNTRVESVVREYQAEGSTCNCDAVTKRQEEARQLKADRQRSIVRPTKLMPRRR